MSEFIDYLQEVFELFGPVRARRMFGGHGLFHEGLMFALVVEDCLYLKADAINRKWFLEAGLGPFQYSRKGRLVSLGYYQAPPEILEEPEQAAAWARRSFEAALRARAGRPPRAGKPD